MLNLVPQSTHPTQLQKKNSNIGMEMQPRFSSMSFM
jgi:hypothetical protein